MHFLNLFDYDLPWKQFDLELKSHVVSKEFGSLMNPQPARQEFVYDGSYDTLVGLESGASCEKKTRVLIRGEG